MRRPLINHAFESEPARRRDPGRRWSRVGEAIERGRGLVGAIAVILPVLALAGTSNKVASQPRSLFGQCTQCGSTNVPAGYNNCGRHVKFDIQIIDNGGDDECSRAVRAMKAAIRSRTVLMYSERDIDEMARSGMCFHIINTLAPLYAGFKTDFDLALERRRLEEDRARQDRQARWDEEEKARDRFWDRLNQEQPRDSRRRGAADHAEDEPEPASWESAFEEFKRRMDDAAREVGGEESGLARPASPRSPGRGGGSEWEERGPSTPGRAHLRATIRFRATAARRARGVSRRRLRRPRRVRFGTSI